MPSIFLSTIKEEVMERRRPWRLRWAALFAIVLIPLGLFFYKPTPPIIVDLPAMHPDFIGRTSELKALKTRLLAKQSGRGINFAAICGEGGIGKTELAIAFANKHLSDFAFIGWVDGSSDEALVHSYAKLGDRLEIREENPGRLREKVHAKLEGGKRWLLILDDVREVPRELPKAGGSLLITCRDRGIASPESVLELSKDREDALFLLAKLTGCQKSKELEDLAKQLDYLPLMINLAGRYIAETPGIDFSHYAALLKEGEPLNWVELRKRYPSSLTASYLTTLKLLEAKHPLSVEFLKEVSCLHHQNIPEELLVLWLEEKNVFSRAQIPIVRGDILRELQNHSLIRYDAKKGDFSIHQLLHQTLQGMGSESCPLNIVAKLDAMQKYNPTQRDSIRPFQRILPHCLCLLEQFPSVPISVTVARYFIDTEHDLLKGGIYLDKAEEWAQEWEHPMRGRIAFLQGMLQFRKERYEDALSYFDRALEIFLAQDVDGLYLGIEQNPQKCTKEYQRAICMEYQGQTLRLLGHLEQAQRRLDESQRAFEMISQEHFDIARILREKALILWEKGRREEAIAKIEEAIAMQEKVYGSSYLFQPAVAATYRILGNFFSESGQYQKADRAYGFAMDVNQKIYQSDDHPFQVELQTLRSNVCDLAGSVQ